MELVRSTSHGGFFVRSILTFVFTVFIAAFLWVVIGSHTANAASTAKWDGNTIIFEEKTYKETTATATSKPPLPSGSKYYRYLENTATGGKSHAIAFPSGVNIDTATTADYTVYTLDSSANFSADPIVSNSISIVPKNTGSSSNSKTAVWENGNLIYDGHSFTGQSGTFRTSDGINPPLPNGTKYYQYLENGGAKAYLIYFSATTDPPTATSGKLVTYDISSNTFGDGVNWNNPSTPTDVKIDSATVGNTTDGIPGETATSCAIAGIGWIICPFSQFLAGGMDKIFEMLKGFLEVEPLSTQTNSPLFQAWNIIRSIANVAFVIAFLILIYSQITSFGISNYSIKKLAPRLIVAAVLVNISYYLCAVFVDISNVAGSGLQEILINLREGLNGTTTNEIASWSSVTGFILADAVGTGAALIGLGGVIVTSGAHMGAAIILLLPMLLGLLIAVLVALIVLAARQAIIVLLIILAPLAFVAYLLPNTEKLFEKWRGLFTTMLVFFPLFALVFGGSQLAAFLIIQTATDINVILLAMFVQVAPLVLTPILVRLSGSLIGRIAGIVNDPKRGFIDRTRNWAKDRSEYMAAKNMARRDPVRNRQVFRRFALGSDERRRTREGYKAAYNARSDARWARSRSFSDIDQITRESSDQKTTGESRSAERYNTWKQNTSGGRRVDTNLRLSQMNMENASHQLERNFEGNHQADIVRARITAKNLAKDIDRIKAEHDREFAELQAGSVSGALRGVTGMNDASAMARDVRRRSDIAKSALNFAEAQQQVDFANLLKDNLAIARDAGGIADEGAKRAQANAGAIITRAKAETIKAIKDATGIKAGDVAAMAREIENAAARGDVLTIRAYSDMLADSANPGAEQLRRVMSIVETRLSGDDLQEVKEHLNSSPVVNAGMEDVATWSRDALGRTLRQVTRSTATYAELTPVAFASNKKSTQIEAFRIGAVSATMADNILSNPAARGNLKPSMQLALENIRAGRRWDIGVDVASDED
jgi:hypothetical protein